MAADKIIYGNIYTVDREQPRAAAVAIADGRFVYVGDESGAKAYIGSGTEVLRYDGGIILPGLGEGHGHLTPGGTEALFTLHLSPFGTLEEHLAMVKEFAEKHHCSVRTISSKFKENTGYSLHLWQMQQKCRMADELMKYDSTLTLKELAATFGFYDEYHFSKSFKKIMGRSPKKRG